MPEGHTIHRAARLQSQRFVGPCLRVWSPQGRFADGAALLDGRLIERIDAHGKHLFYHWDHGLVLHVHLGLFGRFRTHLGDAPDPSAGTRLAVVAPTATLHLSGPTACEILDEAEVAGIVARLGPDPLRGDPVAPGRVSTALARRSVPVGAALLDQAVMAGIGNVYRSELLFLIGIDPHRPARRLSEAEASRVWNEAVRLLRAGERSGRIVTVDPCEVGVARARDIPTSERLYVYGREGLPCRRCGTTIRSEEIGARRAWWCPTCQPQ
ncbi:MAG: zinc finger domain-containing protein [Acidimicrobiia bacterium]|jgi:endonuclease VIII